MVFSPYRLFCFLLLKRAGISTVQASFMYNETAATRKASIYDFFLANTMHDFLYSICGTKCERFSSVQVQAYPENCYISRKTKAAGLPPIPLDVYFFANADSTAATWRFLYPNLCIESLRQRQAYLESYYIHEKQSGTVFTHTA